MQAVFGELWLSSLSAPGAGARRGAELNLFGTVSGRILTVFKYFIMETFYKQYSGLWQKTLCSRTQQVQKTQCSQSLCLRTRVFMNAVFGNTHRSVHERCCVHER